MRPFLLSIFISTFIFMAILNPESAHAGESLQTAGDLFAVLLPLTSGAASLAIDDPSGTVQLVEGTALAMGSTLLLKYAVNEERPNGEDYSFPSGHAAISFSSAEFARKRYGWEYGIPAYAAAAFVGYTRNEEKQHYFHDVLAGAAIGIGSSYLFTSPYSRVNVSGEAGSGYYGIRLAGNW